MLMLESWDRRNFLEDEGAYADTLRPTELMVAASLALDRLRLLEIGNQPSPKSRDSCAEGHQC